MGGVPEILPRHMIKFAEPTVEDLIDALADAIPLARKVVPSEFHAKVIACVLFFVLFFGVRYIISQAFFFNRFSANVCAL